MKPADERLQWAIDACRKARLRLTPVREAVLRHLAGQRTPTSLDQLARTPDIRGRFDEATLYRTLVSFQDAELVRQVGTPHKARHYLLNIPGDDAHFLICRRCGEVSELPDVKSLRKVERMVTDDLGYSGVYHDLEFYGICPDCRAGRRPADSRLHPVQPCSNSASGQTSTAQSRM